MAFEIRNSVALITGGASGIGLCCAQSLLRNGLKGVTLADISEESGHEAISKILQEFGPNKAIFVKTDVSNQDSFAAAFEKTLDTFKDVNLLINNAGVFNDSKWEQEVSVNVNGTINGILLALDKYFPKSSNSEKIIINVASMAGLLGAFTHPIYCSTKWAIIGLSKSFGHQLHYERTRTKILTICPGPTVTPLMTVDVPNKNSLGPEYIELYNKYLCPIIKLQRPESVAEAVTRLIGDGKPTGSVWVVNKDKEAFEYVHSELEIN